MHSLRADLEFFVSNHRDIAAVLEINERARMELPDRLAAFVLEEIEKEAGWNGISNLYAIRNEDVSILWSDDVALWDRKKGWGIYFGLGPFSEDTILNAGGPQNGPFLFLCVEPVGNKAQKKTMVDAVREVITANKGSLQMPGVSFGPFSDDESCIARQPMFDLLTLDKLHKDEREGTIAQIVERARKFCEAIALVLPKLSSLGMVASAPRAKKKGK